MRYLDIKFTILSQIITVTNVLAKSQGEKGSDVAYSPHDSNTHLIDGPPLTAHQSIKPDIISSVYVDKFSLRAHAENWRFNETSFFIWNFERYLVTDSLCIH
jgi:hypothetical protein